MVSLCDVSLYFQRSQVIPPEQYPHPTPSTEQVQYLPFQDADLEIISPGARCFTEKEVSCTFGVLATKNSC